jgi:hypothetical protein
MPNKIINKVNRIQTHALRLFMEGILSLPLLTLLLGGAFVFPWVHWCHDVLHNELLQKYYMPNEIKKNSLRLRYDKKNEQLCVSNGDILPQHELEYFLYESKRRITPMIIIWFVSLFVSPYIHTNRLISSIKSYFSKKRVKTKRQHKKFHKKKLGK